MQNYAEVASKPWLILLSDQGKLYLFYLYFVCEIFKLLEGSTKWNIF